MMKEIIRQFLDRIKQPRKMRGSVVLPALERPTFSAQAEKLLLPELNAIYIVIPKTGCTSVKKFFSNYYGWRESPGVHYPSSEIYQHIFNDDLCQEKYLGRFIFTFVRNPFSRLYSAYRSQVRTVEERPTWIDGVSPRLYRMGIRKEHSFREFVEIVCAARDHRSDPHVKSQWQFVVSNDGKLLADKCYRFENFQHDFLSLLDRLGVNVNPDQLPHENRTQSRQNEYVKHFDHHLIRLVVKRYKKDFEIFGYPETP